MTAPITMAQHQQPIGAYTLDNQSSFKAGNFIVNPPNIQPYSFYDDLKKGDGFFKDALKIVATDKFVDTKATPTKKSSKFKKILGAVTIIALGVLTYKKWNVIVDFLRK